MFRRRISALVVAAALVGGVAIVGGATPASAVDPLAVVLPGPGGPNSLTALTLPDARVGQPYSFQVVAQGGVAPYHWTVEEGLDQLNTYHLGISPSGLISGTPVVPNLPLLIHGVTARYRVTDSAEPPSSVVQRLDVRIYPLPLRITTASLPPGAVGAPYFAYLAAAGGTAPFKFSKGSKLPRGLTLSRAGLISGVPRQGGPFTITVNVTDSRPLPQSAAKTFSLPISGGTGGGGGGVTKPIITAVGDVRCSGALKLKLATVGSAPSYFAESVFSGKLGCTGSTGNARVQVTSAKVAGGFRHSGSCTVRGVHSNSYPSQTSFGPISIAWTAKGGQILPTTVTYSNHSAAATGIGVPGPAGTSNVTGSYAGFNSSNAFVLSPVIATIESQCGGGKRKSAVGATLTINL